MALEHGSRTVLRFVKIKDTHHILQGGSKIMGRQLLVSSPDRVSL